MFVFRPRLHLAVERFGDAMRARVVSLPRRCRPGVVPVERRIDKCRRMTEAVAELVTDYAAQAAKIARIGLLDVEKWPAHD